MLLSKTVKVKMGRTNKRYIEQLNIDYKEGDYVNIKTDDLWDGCNAKIEYQCDYCLENGIKTVYKRKWNDYIKSHKTIMKDACGKCTSKKNKDVNLKLYGVVNKSQLKKNKEIIGNKNRKYAIKDVLIELEKKNYKLAYEIDYKNVNTKIPYICKKHKDLGIQYTSYSKLIANTYCCKRCISEDKSERYKKFTINDIKKLFYEKDLILITDQYLNEYQSLEYICNKHKDKGIQTITLYSFLNKTVNCFYCVENKSGLLFPYEYVEKLFYDNGFILEKGQKYINIKIKMRCYCIKHPDKLQMFSLQQVQNNKSSLCIYCKKDLKEKYVFNLMIKEGLIPTSNAKYYNNSTKIEYKCVKHPNQIQYITYSKFRIGRRCKLCGIEKNKGENHYNWQGGLSELNLHLRGLLRPLIDEKLKEHNYKCYLSGYSGTLEVHHLYSFNKIVKDVLKELKLKVKENISLYSNTEVKNIEELFIKKHEGNWGIPLHPKIHELFHKEFGRKNNNIKQFKEFMLEHKGEWQQIIK